MSLLFPTQVCWSLQAPGLVRLFGAWLHKRLVPVPPECHAFLEVCSPQEQGSDQSGNEDR
jgi:hypothetical protein